MPKKCLYRVNTPDLSQLSILNQSSLILGKKINWRFNYSNICLENKKFVSWKKSSPTDYCWFSTRMCGKNKKDHYFYEVSFLQTRCMYTRNAKITDVCFFFNFNPKTNECVLNFGFAYQSTVDVTSGGDYHCFLLLFYFQNVKLNPYSQTQN